MANFTTELIAKGKTAKNAEELFALAKANDVALTEEEAKKYFEQLNGTSEINDDELAAIAGGDKEGCGSDKNHTLETLPIGSYAEAIDGSTCPGCGATKGVSASTEAYTYATHTPVGLLCRQCFKWINISPKQSTVKLL